MLQKFGSIVNGFKSLTGPQYLKLLSTLTKCLTRWLHPAVEQQAFTAAKLFTAEMFQIVHGLVFHPFSHLYFYILNSCGVTLYN